MGTQNWLHTFRKGIQIGILNSSEPHFLGTKKAVKSGAKKIRQLQQATMLNETDKQEAIYNALLNVYADIENNSLFKVRG
ncbi:hypothetical protein ACFSQP_12580 [Bizionia sediminis]|uniref:Transposase n=1 Tax=Bizionia sediminis TaxID=1737064 RepID=A0ABW5KVE6_9FLAO